MSKEGWMRYRDTGGRELDRRQALPPEAVGAKEGLPWSMGAVASRIDSETKRDGRGSGANMRRSNGQRGEAAARRNTYRTPRPLTVNCQGALAKYTANIRGALSTTRRSRPILAHRSRAQRNRAMRHSCDVG